MTAGPGRCEEASTLSHLVYIPCNVWATTLVDNGDTRPYRMCPACASHNLSNRRGKEIHTFISPVAGSTLVCDKCDQSAVAQMRSSDKVVLGQRCNSHAHVDYGAAYRDLCNRMSAD